MMASGIFVGWLVLYGWWCGLTAGILREIEASNCAWDYADAIF